MGQGEARCSAEHRAGSATGRQPQAGPRPATAERHHRGGRPLTVRGPRRARRATGWQALVWLGPSLALIGAVVAYPAALLIMTSKLFVWIYDYYFGILNPMLQSLGVLHHPVDWLGDDSTVMGAMITVGIFVSLPFTTYVLLAGLQAIPPDVFEAARVDGASAWRTYRSVTFPLLRPALLVAAVLNIIYVFNSFPSVWRLNDRNPGFGHDTMITYMYKIAFKSSLRDVGLAAALGVVNVLLILLAVLVYLRSVRWQAQEA